jgi:hypothetical protein
MNNKWSILFIFSSSLTLFTMTAYTAEFYFEGHSDFEIDDYCYAPFGESLSDRGYGDFNWDADAVHEIPKEYSSNVLEFLDESKCEANVAQKCPRFKSCAHGDMFSCAAPNCEESFEGFLALFHHQQLAHVGKQDDPITQNKRKRKKPHKKILKEAPLAKRPKLSFICKVCDLALTNKAALMRHSKSHDAGHLFECPYCTASYKKLFLLKKHVERHPDFLVDNLDEYFDALTAINGAIQARETKAKEEAQEEFACMDPKCGYRVKNRGQLPRHENIHKKSRAEKCSKCTASFDRTTELTKHMKSCH